MRLMTLFLIALLSWSAHGQPETIAYWAQNDNDLPGGGFGFKPGDFPQQADVGAGTLDLANFNASTTVNGNGDTIFQWLPSFAGSTINALPGFASGGSLSIQRGPADDGNNGIQILLEVSTEGYENIQLSWAQQRTATGFNSSQVDWSADGGQTFNALGNTGQVAGSFELQSFDFSAIEALNDNSDVVFRITLNGASANTGNNRFDNILVQGESLGSGEPSPGDFACVADPADDDLVTRIHAIQGDGFTSPLAAAPGQAGELVEVQAVVIGGFQDSASGQIGGFFLQETDANADDNPLTSEGIYISPVQASVSLPTVSIGQEVRVAGAVRENFGQTEIFQLSNFALCTEDRLAELTPATLALPVNGPIEFEAVEGMWVRLSQSLAVTEVFNAARFAEFTVATNRLFQPTQVVLPGADANALQDLNDRSRLIIDQGLAGSYVTPYQPGLDGTPLNASNPIRAGYRMQADFEGVMGFGFSNYRVYALQPVQFDDSENPRELPPELPAGNLRAASFNVENLFNTIQTGGVGCGPNNLNCRGATSESELARQLIKVTESLMALDVDVAGLIEIENDADDETLALLVDALNALIPGGDWTFIPTGFKGTDAIKNAIIYREGRVAPVGQTAVLDGSVAVNPPFNDGNQRPVLTQAFNHVDGGTFAISVFHLRSKNCGSNASGPNLDQGDGQGCYNALRTESVQSWLNWIDTDPTGTGTDRHLALGDFNAYGLEDPMRLLMDAGYINQAMRFNNDDPAVYSYVFMGQSGSLDHIMASPGMNPLVLGAANWAINADEIPAFAYPETLPASSLPKPDSFFAEDAFRSSDHDPLIITLQLDPPGGDLVYEDRFEQP